jgi:hypothetical protein
MFWRGTKKKLLIEFSNQVADELFSMVPPGLVNKHLSGKSKKATKQFQAGVENALLRIAQFKATEKPGIYGKAKIHQNFAARLKELGYPHDLADEINSYILTKTP